jgi:hypothetical protein
MWVLAIFDGVVLVIRDVIAESMYLGVAAGL